MVRKDQDVRRVLARRCDKSLKQKCKYDEDESHLVSIFTKLMLQGKVRATVRWLSEQHSMGNILLPSDQTEIQGSHRDIIKVSDPKISPNSAILKCDTLPMLEDIEKVFSLSGRCCI